MNNGENYSDEMKVGGEWTTVRIIVKKMKVGEV